MKRIILTVPENTQLYVKSIVEHSETIGYFIIRLPREYLQKVKLNDDKKCYEIVENNNYYIRFNFNGLIEYRGFNRLIAYLLMHNNILFVENIDGV